MHSYLINGSFKNWNADVGTFSTVIDIDFEIDSKDNFYKMVGVAEKHFRDYPVSGYSYQYIIVTMYQKIC